MKKTLILILLSLMTLTAMPSQQKPISFYLVAPVGIISGKYGKTEYLIMPPPGGAEKEARYVVELELKPGTYQYVDIVHRDTVTIAVDSTGAYKLGFVEDHPSCTIYKNDPFASK